MDGPQPRLRVARTDETVRRTVQALITRRSLSIDQVADDVGIPREALKRRLNNSGSTYAFTAGEVRALANYFGIEGGGLCEYMDGQYQPRADWRPIPSRTIAARSSVSTTTGRVARF